MILPTAATVRTRETVNMTSRTYRYDPQSKRLIGYTDDLDAMVQAYMKLLDTERFAWEIYSINYGREFDGLFGQNKQFVIAVLPQRLREALFSDDRTVSIPELTITDTGEETLEVYCRVLTTEGEIAFQKEVVL